MEDRAEFLSVRRVTELIKFPSAFTLFFSAYSTLNMEMICPQECRLTFNGLHFVISQKIVIFMTTAVNLKSYIVFLCSKVAAPELRVK
jgi:hypothetical protein